MGRRMVLRSDLGLGVRKDEVKSENCRSIKE